MKNLVIISRKWHHPKISMVVTDEALSFAIDLDDFVAAMKEELLPTNGVFFKIDEAVSRVLKGIKGESVRIM